MNQENEPRKTLKTRKKIPDLLYIDEVYCIQGAIFEVYKKMGCGFLEAVYQECLEIEFKESIIGDLRT